MAISYLNTSPLAHADAGGSLSVPLGFTPQAGDLVIITSSNNGGVAITGPGAGWTAIDVAQNAGNWAIGSWWHTVTDSSDNTWNISCAAGNALKAYAIQLRSTKTSLQVIDAHSTLDTAAAAMPSTAIYATFDSDYLLTWWGGAGNSTAATLTPNDLTAAWGSLGNDGTGCFLYGGYVAVGATGLTTAYSLTETSAYGGKAQQVLIVEASEPDVPKILYSKTNTATSATATTGTLATAPTAGNLQVVTITAKADATATGLSLTWDQTRTVVQGGTNLGITLLTRTATGSEGTTAETFTLSTSQYYALAYYEIADWSSFETNAPTIANNTTSATTPALDPSADYALLLAYFGKASGAGTSATNGGTPESLWYERADVANSTSTARPRIYVETFQQATHASDTATVTWNTTTASYSGGGLIAILPPTTSVTYTRTGTVTAAVSTPDRTRTGTVTAAVGTPDKARTATVTAAIGYQAARTGTVTAAVANPGKTRTGTLTAAVANPGRTRTASATSALATPDRTRTAGTVTAALGITGARSAASGAALATPDLSRTATVTAALEAISVLERTGTVTAALGITGTRSATVSAALRTERTAALTAALSTSAARTAATAVALDTPGRTRTGSVTAALLTTGARSAAATAALSTTTARTATATAAVASPDQTRTATVTAALAATGVDSRTASVTAAVGLVDQSRTATATAALGITGARTATTTAALRAERTASVSAAVGIVAARTATVTAAVEVTGVEYRTASVTAAVALVDTTRTAGVTGALGLVQTRTATASAALGLTATRTAGTTGALTTSGVTRTATVTAALAVAGTLSRTATVTGALANPDQARQAAATVALQTPGRTRQASTTAALELSSTRTATTSAALGLVLERTAAATAALTTPGRTRTASVTLAVRGLTGLPAHLTVVDRPRLAMVLVGRPALAMALVDRPLVALTLETDMASFDVGDVCEVQTTITALDTAGVYMPTDADVLTLLVEDPAGTVTSYTLAAAELTKRSTGVYYGRFALDAAGTWRYRWEATGAIVGAEGGHLRVRAAAVVAAP